MRIFQTLLWGFVALACAAPTCDTHPDGWATVGSGSGAGSGESTLAGSAKQHDDVVRAMESVTGAKLDHPASKLTKPVKQKTHSSDSGGNYGRSQPPSPPPPPPKPRLPDSGRLIGQPCDDHEQCLSNTCEFDYCAKKSGSTKLGKGEKCDYQSDCESSRCYEDKCD